MKKLSLFSAYTVIFFFIIGSAFAAEPPKENNMQKVLGVGGLFFRSENPEHLAKWYETHLGISLVPTSYEQKPWYQDAGPTVFAPFEKDTTYFGNPEQNWMVNFRVADLKAIVAQLRTAGITVEEPQSHPKASLINSNLAT